MSGYAKAMSNMKASFGHKLREVGAKMREVGSDQVFMRHRPNMTFNGHRPFKTNDTFIAPNASVIGDVTNWDRSSVWYGAIVRADSEHPIEIGYCSSIGAGSVLTTLPSTTTTLETGFLPETHVGHYVIVGAGSVLKSCRVDDLVVIGDNCTIMEGAIIENNVHIESGSLVPAYARIPSGQLWGGNPARYIRDLTEAESDVNTYKRKCKDIHEIAKDHILELLPIGFTYVHLEELEKQAKDALSEQEQQAA